MRLEEFPPNDFFYVNSVVDNFVILSFLPRFCLHFSYFS